MAKLPGVTVLEGPSKLQFVQWMLLCGRELVVSLVIFFSPHAVQTVFQLENRQVEYIYPGMAKQNHKSISAVKLPGVEILWGLSKSQFLQWMTLVDRSSAVFMVFFFLGAFFLSFVASQGNFSEMAILQLGHLGHNGLNNVPQPGQSINSVDSVFAILLAPFLVLIFYPTSNSVRMSIIDYIKRVIENAR